MSCMYVLSLFFVAIIVITITILYCYVLPIGEAKRNGDRSRMIASAWQFSGSRSACSS